MFDEPVDFCWGIQGMLRDRSHGMGQACVVQATCKIHLHFVTLGRATANALLLEICKPAKTMHSARTRQFMGWPGPG